MGGHRSSSAHGSATLCQQTRSWHPRVRRATGPGLAGNHVGVVATLCHPTATTRPRRLLTRPSSRPGYPSGGTVNLSGAGASRRIDGCPTPCCTAAIATRPGSSLMPCGCTSASRSACATSKSFWPGIVRLSLRRVRMASGYAGAQRVLSARPNYAVDCLQAATRRTGHNDTASTATQSIQA